MRPAANNRPPAIAAATQHTVPAEASSEPRTDPCDVNKPDDDCWMLPRERADFAEATFTNNGPVIRFDRENENLAFYYEYPKSVEIDKKLAAFLHNDAVAQYHANLETGRDDRAKALKLGASPRAYKKIIIETVWALTARSPHLIGLVENDGNANVHEQVLETPLIWDRQRAKMIKFSDLFIDPKAALRVMQPDYCNDLKQEVADRLNEAAKSAPDEGTSNDVDPVDCPDLAELPAPVPVNDHGRIRGFTILVGHFRVWADGPYQAGAEVTPQLIALIKPEYRSDFEIAPPARRAKK